MADSPTPSPGEAGAPDPPFNLTPRQRLWLAAFGSPENRLALARYYDQLGTQFHFALFAAEMDSYASPQKE